jgi:predicted lysophospholipase L1 biosynthesis ABC-type transport system permease subunit
VVRGGDIAVDRSQPRSAIVGGDVLPIRVAATGARLPGAADGLLADLDYADRLSPDAGDRVTTEVWLGRDAPTGIDAALASAGLTLLGERGIAGRQSELDARGPATALRFLVIVALVAIAMALLSFAVAAAAERRPRGVELAGLRRQGLPARVVRRVGLSGYPALALAAVGLGLVAGMLLVALMPAPLPAFADAFVAPAPPPVPVLPLAAAALACLAGFAVVGLAAGAGLAVAARRSTARGSAWSD